MTKMEFSITSVKNMQDFGVRFGALLRGGEVIELIGDVGAGKTTLTKAIALGMGIVDDVQSPTFTISRVYQSPRGISLAHYDFFRLSDPGIMSMELAESTADASNVTIIEWAEIVAGVLPQDRLSITITTPTEESRVLTISAGGMVSQAIIEALV